MPGTQRELDVRFGPEAHVLKLVQVGFRQVVHHVDEPLSFVSLREVLTPCPGSFEQGLDVGGRASQTNATLVSIARAGELDQFCIKLDTAVSKLRTDSPELADTVLAADALGAVVDNSLLPKWGNASVI